MRIYRNESVADGLDPDRIARLVASAHAADAQLLKEESDGRVVLVDDGATSYVVKLYRVAAIKAYVYQRFRGSRAWREFRGARRLSAAGVSAAIPIALVDRPEGSDWSQALVLPYIDGAPLSHWLKAGDSTDAQRGMVFEAIGRQLGKLTGGGLINRDHKSANLMIDPEQLDAEPTVIDPAGIRRRTPSRVGRMVSVLRETTQRYPNVTADDLNRCFAAARAVDPTLPEFTDDQ